MILVTGTPRCGTHYTAALLRELGLKVRHEALDEDGAVSWKHLGEGEFYVPERKRATQIHDPGFDVRLHQIRHPLTSISSMQTLRDCSWEFMARHVEIDMNAPIAIRGMQCWLNWNQLAESKTEWRYRIEELATVFPEFLRRLRLPEQPLPELPPRSKESRVDRFTKLTWENLLHADESLAKQIAELASKYGYAIPELGSLKKIACPEPPDKPSRMLKAIKSVFRR